MVGRAKVPKAPKVDMGYLMRQEQRIPMMRGRIMEVASKAGVTPMLGKF
jgi:hypothetical protein